MKKHKITKAEIAKLMWADVREILGTEPLYSILPPLMFAVAFALFGQWGSVMLNITIAACSLFVWLVIFLVVLRMEHRIMKSVYSLHNRLLDGIINSLSDAAHTHKSMETEAKPEGGTESV